MAWVPVDDSQTPNWSQLVPAVPAGWGLFPTGNTPNWGIISPVAAGAFQFGAFQPAFQVSAGSPVWNPVDDSQTGVWTPIPP